MSRSLSQPPQPSRHLVMYTTPHFLTDALSRFFTGALGEDFRRVLEKFPREHETYVVGGVVRDLLLAQLRGIEKPVGDIDLVIKGAASSQELRILLDDFESRANRMGGIKFSVRPKGVRFDVWRIEDHVNLMVSGPPYTIERLLRHFLLDIDAVVWDPRTGSLYDYGCLRAIQAGTIDLLGTEGISRELAPVQAAHILLIKHGTRFSLATSACDLIRETWRSRKQDEVYAVLQEKQPGAMRALGQLIQEVLADLPVEEIQLPKG